jgi:hypothetical protein
LWRNSFLEVEIHIEELSLRTTRVNLFPCNPHEG